MSTTISDLKQDPRKTKKETKRRRKNKCKRESKKNYRKKREKENEGNGFHTVVGDGVALREDDRAISGLEGGDLAKGELGEEGSVIVRLAKGEGGGLQLKAVVLGGDEGLEGAGVVGV